MRRPASLFAISALVGCSASAAQPRGDADAGDAGGGIDPAGLPVACDATCKETTLAVHFGGKDAAFDRAVYGVQSDGTLQIEAYAGGDPGCPTMTSKTPNHTLVLTGLAFPSSPAPITTVAANLLDFQGDLTPTPSLPAKTVRVVPIAAMAGSFVALTVTATFDGGTLDGAIYATHCASLEP